MSSQSRMWLSNERLCDMCVYVYMWKRKLNEKLRGNTLMNNKTNGGWLTRV